MGCSEEHVQVVQSCCIGVTVLSRNWLIVEWPGAGTGRSLSRFGHGVSGIAVPPLVERALSGGRATGAKTGRGGASAVDAHRLDLLLVAVADGDLGHLGDVGDLALGLLLVTEQ